MNTNNKWDPFALLLIDVQQSFYSGMLPKEFPNFPNNITRLLSFCRDEGLEIVHLKAIFKEDMSNWMLRYRLRGSIPCIEGTTGAETLPFAAEEPGEAVFIKQTFDGFHNPELLPHLRKRGKRFLLTAGLITSACVFLTTASAAQLGFLAAVVEDCCADFPPMHEDTLERYQYIFDRTTTDMITENRTKWLEELSALEM
jgi:nicotinamidase-related amidase